jgi:methyl-accepting chemotaxis protein
MDIAGTKRKIQRATKVAEESYKKMNELLERMQRMQQDVETTSEQVDRIEYDVARQGALIEAIAESQGLDTDEVLAAADLPEPPEGVAEQAVTGDGESAEIDVSEETANDEGGDTDDGED